MMVVPLVELVLKEKRDELCCHAGDTQHCVKPLTLWAPAMSQTDHQLQGDEGSVKINLRLHCSHLLLIRIPSKPSFHSLHWKQFLLGSWWMRAHKFNTTLHPVDKIEKNCTMNLKKPWHHLVRAKEDPDQETTIYLQPKKHWWELSSVGFMSSVVKSKTWSKTSKLQLLPFVPDRPAANHMENKEKQNLPTLQTVLFVVMFSAERQRQNEEFLFSDTEKGVETHSSSKPSCIVLNLCWINPFFIFKKHQRVFGLRMEEWMLATVMWRRKCLT